MGRGGMSEMGLAGVAQLEEISLKPEFFMEINFVLEKSFREGIVICWWWKSQTPILEIEIDISV